MTTPFSIFPETQWPAIASPYAAGMLSLLFQLEHTQWWSPETVALHQERQLHVLLEHAYATVPFYRERFDAASIRTREDWSRIPPLSRRDIQLAAAALHSSAPPKNHGELSKTTTGGSTGQPVTVVTTGMTELFWRALTMRDHFWHRRDLSQSFAAIRYTEDNAGMPPNGAHADSWGSGARNIFPTGPGHLLNIKSSIDEQVEWLQRVNPAYLLGYPSALEGVAKEFEARGWRLPGLQEILTFGEVVSSDVRAACRRAFGVQVVDEYSSQEVGYIALQCPQCESYHVQSESLFVEVLDDAGRPCKQGQIGKVVLTTMHNFAMPLIRYDIEDFAEVGEPCRCGRGLPVLKRILGRQRNLLVMPNGERRWPVFVSEDGSDELPPFFQFQVVQRSLHELDLNVVRPGGELTADEHALVERHFHKVLGYPFKLTVNCLASIPRSPTGKFEDFISLVR
jgi:phenylacetate-CoA ligase